MKGRLLITFLAVLFMAFFEPAYAQDPWENFANLLIEWITGNLGKTLSLLGMLIAVFILLVTHSWRIFLYAVVISVLIGGLVGITRMFFEAGSGAFGTGW